MSEMRTYAETIQIPETLKRECPPVVDQIGGLAVSAMDGLCYDNKGKSGAADATD